jgi:tRNA-dihydrouridine synthase B
MSFFMTTNSNSAAHSLGPFAIEHPFILAPMAGITNSPFRRLMRRYDSALVISELISANGIFWGNDRTRELLKYKEDERHIGLQIFGEVIENLTKACELIESIGADFVDLNLGCPVPKIVSKGAGAALCRDPLRLSKVLSAMVKSTRIPVTIKIRTGWDAECINALEVVRVAEEAGVRWVAIHGRTRAQQYTGLADWELIANIKAKVGIPIIGNGDLQTPALAVKRYRESGVDAVLIGRGALRNPFIFRQAKKLLIDRQEWVPAAEDYFELLRTHQKLLTEEPLGVELLHAKKFLSWYSAGFENSAAFRKNVFNLKTVTEVWDLGFQFFEENILSRDLRFLEEPFLMGGHG